MCFCCSQSFGISPMDAQLKISTRWFIFLPVSPLYIMYHDSLSWCLQIISIPHNCFQAQKALPSVEAWRLYSVVMRMSRKKIFFAFDSHNLAAFQHCLVFPGRAGRSVPRLCGRARPLVKPRVGGLVFLQGSFSDASRGPVQYRFRHAFGTLVRARGLNK